MVKSVCLDCRRLVQCRKEANETYKKMNDAGPDNITVTCNEYTFVRNGEEVVGEATHTRNPEGKLIGSIYGDAA